MDYVLGTDVPLSSNGSTYNFSTLQWCESNMHSAEAIFQILNFHYFLDKQYEIILCQEAGQLRRAAAPSQPHNFWGKQ